jgi:hypothetical protein
VPQQQQSAGHKEAAVANIVHTSETQACGAGIPGCCCDLMDPAACDHLGYPRGMTLGFCDCHDCYVCGEIDCDGHDD